MTTTESTAADMRSTGSGSILLPLAGMGIALICAIIPSMWAGMAGFIACFILAICGLVVNWPHRMGAFALSILALLIGILGIIGGVLISIAWQTGQLS